MGYAIYRTRRIVGESEGCRHCRGIGTVRARTGSAEVTLCPRCGGSGVEPPPLGDSVLWPQEETAVHGADGDARSGPDALLQCRYARRNGAGIVRASGEIDLRNVHRLAEILDQALSDSRTVIVDFGGVSYIDSTGLNTLVRLHEQCAQRKTGMAVVVTSRTLRRIFSVLGLQDVFRIFPTVDAALQALSHPDGPGGPSANGRRANHA